MGTSSSFGGQKGGTPLIPSWLGDGDTAPSSNGNDSSQGDGTADGSTDAAQPATANPPTAPVPQSAPPTRFQASRTNFTRFVKSGGQDRASLGRAMSGYVSTASGGARTAAQKMGASRAGGVNLANFLANVRTQGVTTALQSLNLDTLAGRPIEEVFLGLIDYVCPENGSIDAGIARDAFVETIVDLAELGITDLNTLTADQMQTVLELYVTHAIEARLCNDIGTKIAIASDTQDFDRVQEQLRDFIQGGVSDALTQARNQMEALTPERTTQFIDRIYEQSFAILQSLGEQEAER